jgi:hypothetical protein
MDYDSSDLLLHITMRLQLSEVKESRVTLPQ